MLVKQEKGFPVKKKKEKKNQNQIKPRRKETDGQDVEKLEPLSIHIGQFKWGSH